MNTSFLTNPVGYLPQGGKHFVMPMPPTTAFRVIREADGTTLHTGELRHVDAELGSAWVGDFTDVREETLAQIVCGDLVSPFVIIHRSVYDVPLRTLFNYYPLQRCGDSRLGWATPCHCHDAIRSDTGEHVDLSGGWHQSCDLRKWMSGTPFGLAGLAQYGLCRNPAWAGDQVADELRWGNRYFLKMIRPDGGIMDHVTVPNNWEQRTVFVNDPPRFASYLLIIGEALAARYLADRDPEESRRCLDGAKRIWTYMRGPTAPKGPYHPDAMPTGHEWMIALYERCYALECADALYAALALYGATGEPSFFDQAAGLATELVGLQIGGDVSKDPAAGSFRLAHGSDEMAALTFFGHLGLAEIASLAPDHVDAPRWKEAAVRAADQKCMLAERNPWGLVPSYWYRNAPGAGRPGGSASYRYFLRQKGIGNAELRLGVNGDIGSAAVFLLRMYRLTGNERYLKTACRQVDWILGVNPFNASTVEGLGLNQPKRFISPGEFFPPTPQIPGAVMTGIIGDEDDHPEPLGNFVSIEYDMPCGAPLMWFLSELTREP